MSFLQLYTSILNHRTVISIVVAIVTTFVAFRFDIDFNVDLTLISIAMIFPLVFTIRGSFRRREKALEHLSQFRASLKTVHFFFMSNKDLPVENKEEVNRILLGISDSLMRHLRKDNYDTEELDKTIDTVYSFISEREELFNRRIRDKVYRFMNDLHESIENLHGIHTHRTPISLKAYCLVFIYIFPLIYAPVIINNIGANTSEWVTYSIVLITEYILISLYNIQDKLEYPFDDDGLDDIKLDNFRFDR